jgi:hypothetical protein
MRACWLLGCAGLLALGCGSNKFAPVSGKVTRNGRPLPNVTVSFQPIAEQGTITAGTGSIGKTNENGEFTLKAATGESGAWVGKHRVILSILSPKTGEGDERRRGGPQLEDQIPPEWNQNSQKTFDVPAGGTDQANFEVGGKPTLGKR